MTIKDKVEAFYKLAFPDMDLEDVIDARSEGKSDNYRKVTRAIFEAADKNSDGKLSMTERTNSGLLDSDSLRKKIQTRTSLLDTKDNLSSTKSKLHDMTKNFNDLKTNVRHTGQAVAATAGGLGLLGLRKLMGKKKVQRPATLGEKLKRSVGDLKDKAKGVGSGIRQMLSKKHLAK